MATDSGLTANPWEAVREAADLFLVARALRLLKQRSHRAPRTDEVAREIRAFLKDGRFYASVDRMILKVLEQAKGEGFALDPAGFELVAGRVRDRLQAYTKLLVGRPAGRPRKPRPKGLINTVPTARLSPPLKNEKIQIRVWKRRLINHAAGAKLRGFMRSEGVGGLELSAAKSRVLKHSLLQDVADMRTNARAVRAFMAKNKVPDELTSRLEKALSRSKAAVAEALTKVIGI